MRRVGLRRRGSTLYPILVGMSPFCRFRVTRPGTPLHDMTKNRSLVGQCRLRDTILIVKLSNETVGSFMELTLTHKRDKKFKSLSELLPFSKQTPGSHLYTTLVLTGVYVGRDFNTKKG